MTPYEQGFLTKCAGYGLNPVIARRLLKVAQQQPAQQQNPPATVTPPLPPAVMPFHLGSIKENIAGAKDWIAGKRPGTSTGQYVTSETVYTNQSENGKTTLDDLQDGVLVQPSNAVTALHGFVNKVRGKDDGTFGAVINDEWIPGFNGVEAYDNWANTVNGNNKDMDASANNTVNPAIQQPQPARQTA